MGGKALKNTETRRYEAAEYYALEKEVLDKLRAVYPGRQIAAIPAYNGKESFGDMDVLFESDNMHQNVRDVLVSVFSPNEIVKNGNCYSFDVNQLQVDLILTPNAEFLTSFVYFSFNDLGNLMGRIYHAMGMKYGHEGLVYAVYDPEDPGHRIEEILVSRDHEKIFEIAGYSFKRWSEGFKNLEEIFNFAIDTPYYSYAIFDLENRNHRSRMRDRKRPTYTKFLDWAKDKPGRFDWGDHTNDGDFDRTAYLDRISEFFPDFRVKYDEAIARNEERKHVATLYNGERISELTGLIQKDLGMFMKHLKENVKWLRAIAAIKPRDQIAEIIFDGTVRGEFYTYNNKNKEVGNVGGKT